MSITYNELLNEVKRIIQPVLKPRDYILLPPPLTSRSMIWFVKEPRSIDPLYRIVEFQPDGFSQNEITRIAINLQRRTYQDYDNPPERAMHENDLHVRLSPRLWKEKSNVMDYWWYINPAAELTDKLNDMLEKIVNHGIPFLEDMNSTQMSWLRR